MRGLIGACAVVVCLSACSRSAVETITDVDAPFGGVYSLREMNEAALPLHFSPLWYPGRGSSPGMLYASLLSGDLLVRADGTFTWTTLLEEVATKPNTVLVEYVTWKIRREANGTWTYTPSTGAVSLQGTDQFGAYQLTGTATSTEVTLSSTFEGRTNSRFVLER